MRTPRWPIHFDAGLTPPNYDYVAYIDEAGDDGLNSVWPNHENGASEWLILSAVVIRRAHEASVTGWIEEIGKKIRHRQAEGIHFVRLNQAVRKMVCDEMASLPIRCFVVCSNKKNMEGYQNPDAERIPSQNWFYCWMTRLLLERVTLFVHEHSMSAFGEARKVRLEYSARGGLNYAQMAAYYDWLNLKKHDPFLPWGKLNFEVMDVHLMHVYPHQERAGLQLADVVASSFFAACDRRQSPCDDTFARALIGRMARQPDKIMGTIGGFGVKLLPSWKTAALRKDQRTIFRSVGYPDEVWWDPEAFSSDL